MKQTKNLIAIAACAIVFASCQKDLQRNDSSLQTQSTDKALTAGMEHVFVLSNQVDGNKVLGFEKATDGTLTFVKGFSTGGTGTGAGLGNQGAIAISPDKQILLAINAGDNSISSMRITDKGLKLASHVASGGTIPVSVTMYGDLVYVLNSGAEGNISGFKLSSDGTLEALANSTKSLSSTAAGAAQVSFVQDGKVLVVTEKATNTITSYKVMDDGTPGEMHTINSANATPFGFAVGRNNIIYVSEAAGGALGASTLSSYYVGRNGSIKLISGPVAAYQSAACWVVLNKNGKYAYTTNTGSNNISSFKVTAAGNINISEGIAATAGMAPIDATINDDGTFLYVLNGGSHEITAYTLASDGTISNIQTLGNVPEGATGMAAD